MRTYQITFSIITIFIAIFTILALNKPALAEDTTPPTFVSITGDTSGTTGETVTLEAVVEDDVGVTEVVFNIGTPVTATRAPNVQGVQGTYRVTVPLPSKSADDIPYYVEASDAAGNTARAPETGTYTITVTDNDAPTVTVISPNGGEVAGIKTRYDILWESEDNIGVSFIDIFYSTDSGSSWKEIKKGEANDGLYEWTVPDDPTTTALVKVVATDGAGNNGEDVSDGVFTIKFITVSFPFFDDFESGLKNWEVTGSWGVTEESAKSGTKSLTDSPMTLYGNNVNTYAQFKINLVGSKRPILTFWTRYNLASGDYVYVEFSKDGSNWDRVYYQVGTNPDWKQQQIDLRRYAGESQVYIRFRIQTDGSAINDGWYVDDVSVDENTTTVAFPFFDDMETADSENNWIASNWRRISTSGHSGTSSWRIDTSGSNPDYSDIWLTLSAPLDLSKVVNPQLVFWHRYKFRYQYGRVYVSTDGGKNFTQITSYYYATQNNFTRVQLDLSPYAGSPQVVIGFKFDWDRDDPSDFWEIDDVAIDSAADPVLLHTPKNATQHSLDLSWAKSVEPNFAYYALYRRTNPSGSWQWVTSIDDINTTQFTDNNLEIRRTYYYIIYVVKTGDVYGISSNEVFATTLGVSYPFSDDFENGVANWDVIPSWDVTTEEAHGGDYSLTDSPMTLYGNNINTYVTTGMNLSGSRRPILTFYDIYNLASGDFAYVEISKDNEVNWDRVYYQVGTNLTWTKRQIDLRRYAGESQVRIRFRIQTDGSAIQDGWYVDDVSITEHTTTVAFPFFDDMETTESENNWIASNWRRISTSGHSGTSSWRIDTSGSNPDNSDIWLTLSAPLDLSKVVNPQLVFWHRYKFRYQYGRVYVSTDGGKNFTQITSYYYATQNNFTRVQLDLSPYAGSSQVVIGFKFDWDRDDPSDFWEIDDVAIDSAADPILLHTPKNATQHSLDLSWAKSVEPNFAYYALYRRTNPSGSWQWVTSIDDINTTQYTDNNLEIRRTYYYIIYVVKKGDVYGVASNEVFGTTLGVSYPFYDDFENGVANWDVKPSWDVTTEESHGGDYSLTDSPMTLYGNNINTYVTTGLNLSGSRRPILTFWEIYNLVSGDFAYMEISKDNEVNWDRVYFQTGTNLTWTQRQIDLRRYAGESQVRIRFRIQTDGSAIQDGWYIDDVSIAEHTTTVAFPFFDDMENADSENNWIPSRWRRISTSGHSGTSSWRIDTSGSNPDYSDIWLVLSAPIDLSAVAKPQLVFWHRYKFRYQYGRVYVSTDGGKNFTQITSYYYATQNNFTRVQLDLSPYAGSPQVVIGFKFDWDRDDPSDFWEIDDIAIVDPSVMVDFGQLESPGSITVDAGAPTGNIYGLVYEAGVTDKAGQGGGIIAQLGYGLDGSTPDDGWTWVNATYDSDVDKEPGDKKYDKYVATLTVGQSGVYDYAYRYRLEISTIWIYADLDGNDIGSGGFNGYSPSQAGDLTVGVGTKPIITSISPDSGPVGTLVTIAGENFGTQQGDSKVTFNGIDAGAADSWSDTEIQIKVPEGATTGPVVVTVNGQASNNDKIFTVEPAAPCAFADIDGDGDVDIVDIQKVAGRWGTKAGDPDYVPEYDIDSDGDIDIVDIQKVAGCWGTVLPSATGVVATNTLELKPASPVQVSIQPRLQKLTISGTAMIEVEIENVSNLGAFEVTLGYDNSVVQVATSGTQLGDFLSSSGRTVIPVGSKIDNNQGTFSYGAFSIGENGGPSGEGILVRIPLTAKGEGQTMLKLTSVKLTDIDGKPIDVGRVKNGLVKVVPQETALAPNFPNPFNPDTWIPYQLSKDARVTIEFYSLSGKLIRVLDLGYKEAGFYTDKSNAAYWNGRNQAGEKVASGVYFYHLKAGDFHATRKLLVTK